MNIANIRRLGLLRLLSFATVFLFVLPAASQTPQKTSPPGRRYDPAAEVTVKGTIEAVERQEGRKGWAGVHITLKTEKETLTVHLGPAWFLEKNKMELAKNDEVEITGSRVKFGEKDVLLARLLKKGEQSLTLRDEQGIPAWSRGPRKRPARPPA